MSFSNFYFFTEAKLSIWQQIKNIFRKGEKKININLAKDIVILKEVSQSKFNDIVVELGKNFQKCKNLKRELKASQIEREKSFRLSLPSKEERARKVEFGRCIINQFDINITGADKDNLITPESNFLVKVAFEVGRHIIHYGYIIAIAVKVTKSDEKGKKSSIISKTNLDKEVGSNIKSFIRKEKQKLKQQQEQPKSSDQKQINASFSFKDYMFKNLMEKVEKDLEETEEIDENTLFEQSQTVKYYIGADKHGLDFFKELFGVTLEMYTIGRYSTVDSFDFEEKEKEEKKKEEKKKEGKKYNKKPQQNFYHYIVIPFSVDQKNQLIKQLDEYWGVPDNIKSSKLFKIEKKVNIEIGKEFLYGNKYINKNRNAIQIIPVVKGGKSTGKVIILFLDGKKSINDFIEIFDEIPILKENKIGEKILKLNSINKTDDLSKINI